MKATLFGIGILLLAAGTCTPVRADYPYYNNTWYGPTLPQAPAGLNAANRRFWHRRTA